MSLMCSKGDKSHETKMLKSRADSTTGKFVSFILRQVLYVALPIFKTQYLLTETDSCHSVDQHQLLIVTV